jgi:phosphoribosylformylglycinamidine cyclo-ligase
MAERKGLDYAAAGVDIAAGEALVEAIGPAAARTARPGATGGLGGFGALFDLKAAGYRDPLLVAATDGVGTKLKVAIETGRLSGLGVDLVAMSANDLVCQGAEPLFFLDYYACGRLRPEAAAEVVRGVAEGCRLAGCALIGGETAEMPGLYAGADFDLAGFAVGAVERGEALPRQARPGDVLIGLASDGAHANGFSLIRRVAAEAGLYWDAPAPFAPERTLGEALLQPTRIYVGAALALARELGAAGLAHVTGGGLPGNVPRMLGGLGAEIDLDAWETPALFRWIAEAGGVAPEEMLRAFNCGVGMVAALPAEREAEALARIAGRGETAFPLGRVAEAPGVRFAGRLW